MQALGAFWTGGYAGTSLDELSDATGMNRPSLYLAFGDKRTLYLKALEQYWRASAEAMRTALAPDVPLPEALMRVYRTALSFYFPKTGQPRGCFAISTAAPAAIEDAEIRSMFAEGLARLDAAFERRIALAQAQGELSDTADPASLAQMASATLHSLAIRARAGMPKRTLEAFARDAVAMICGR